jgi:DNA replication ATP-dependent helicase Dna2
MKLLETGMADTSAARPTPAIIRVGQKSSCHSAVRTVLASEVARGLELDRALHPSAESLRKVISSAAVVAVTALSIPRSPLLIGEHFDVVIVDEAGQISQPAILGALMAADSFVLVGDHMQLPPLVSSDLAEKGGEHDLSTTNLSSHATLTILVSPPAGFGDSMLKRLAEQHPNAVAQLTFQYRMHEDICQLSNDIIYGGSLRCGNDEVRRRKLDLPGFPENMGNQGITPTGQWLVDVVDPNHPVIFMDTDKLRSSSAECDGMNPLERSVGLRNGGSIVNDSEALLVQLVVGNLIDCGLHASSVGVISPFRAQVSAVGCTRSLRNIATLTLQNAQRCALWTTLPS